MIPSDVRLFTWLDVEEVVARAAAEAPPPWLVRASAYWNELTVSVKNNNSENARQWIRELFDPRITNLQDADTLGVVLEAVNGDNRVLPVVFEEIDEAPSRRPLPPTFHRPSAVEQGRTLARPQLPLGAPPIAAFHSFKGGVGRTTQAVSLAAAASKKQSVLLLYPDVNPPPLTFILRSRSPS